MMNTGESIELVVLILIIVSIVIKTNGLKSKIEDNFFKLVFLIQKNVKALNRGQNLFKKFYFYTK